MPSSVAPPSILRPAMWQLLSSLTFALCSSFWLQNVDICLQMVKNLLQETDLDPYRSGRCPGEESG